MLVLAEALFVVATLDGLEVVAHNFRLLGNILRKRIADRSYFILAMCKVAGVTQLAIAVSKMSANAGFILAAIGRRSVDDLSAGSLTVALAGAAGLGGSIGLLSSVHIIDSSGSLKGSLL